MPKVADEVHKCQLVKDADDCRNHLIVDILLQREILLDASPASSKATKVYLLANAIERLQSGFVPLSPDSPSWGRHANEKLIWLSNLNHATLNSKL